MTFTANGRRQKLNFLASVLSRLYTKVKIFAFTVNKRFFTIFLLDCFKEYAKMGKIRIIFCRLPLP